MIVWKIDSSLNLPLIPVTLIFPISILDGNRLIVEDETTYKQKNWIQITNKHKTTDRLLSIGATILFLPDFLNSNLITVKKVINIIIIS